MAIKKKVSRVNQKAIRSPKATKKTTNKKVAKKKVVAKKVTKKVAKKKVVAKKVTKKKASKKKVVAKKVTKKKKIKLSHKEIKPYIQRKNESYMNQAQLKHFGNILTSWRGELIAEVFKTVIYMKDEAAKFPDSADRATQESEFGLELRTRDRERKLLRKIDSALNRIASNSYGFCEDTGEKIGIRRLEARPVATLCLEAQERREHTERQFKDSDDRYR